MEKKYEQLKNFSGNKLKAKFSCNENLNPNFPRPTEGIPQGIKWSPYESFIEHYKEFYVIPEPNEKYGENYYFLTRNKPGEGLRKPKKDFNDLLLGK
jgi:hypothetical protein